MADKKHNAYKNLALISQLGINVMVPTFLCLFMDWKIHRNMGGYSTAVSWNGSRNEKLLSHGKKSIRSFRFTQEVRRCRYRERE